MLFFIFHELFFYEIKIEEVKFKMTNSNKMNISQQMKNMTNKMKNDGSKIDYKKLLQIFILLMLTAIIIYILISAFYYYRTDCEDGIKRPFFEYLADIQNRALCVAVPKTDSQKDFKLSDAESILLFNFYLESRKGESQCSNKLRKTREIQNAVCLYWNLFAQYSPWSW